MTEMQRGILLRYLHERGNMSPAERLAVEWQLLTNRASRDAYAEMGRMHRALSFHFGASPSTGLPIPRFSWLRTGIFGVIGAVTVAGSLLGIQGYHQSQQANAATLAAKSRCPICHKVAAQCPHCSYSTASIPPHCLH